MIHLDYLKISAKSTQTTQLKQSMKWVAARPMFATCRRHTQCLHGSNWYKKTEQYDFKLAGANEQSQWCRDSTDP